MGSLVGVMIVGFSDCKKSLSFNADGDSPSCEEVVD